MNIISQTEKIYNHLCDDISRDIFENRLLYSLTGNCDFINNITALSCEKSALKEYKDKLSAPFKKYKNNDVIVYGAGYLGEHFITICENINIVAFCDSDTKRHGNMFRGYKIISPEQLQQEYNNAFVIVAALDEKAVSEITEKLLTLKIAQDRILNFLHIYRLNSIKMNYLREMQYFDPDIILSRISKDEIFIDGGCCNCYTDIQFVKSCTSKYKKIIAFEPNPKQYLKCVENAKSIQDITIHPYGLWNENTELIFDNSGAVGGAHISNEEKESAVKIKTAKLDDILDKEKVTFIKLDVEGAELNSLKGAEQMILKNRPKLAVCIYHKPEDVWEIPAYILSLNNEYKLYVRHYSFGSGETVLYAV